MGETIKSPLPGTFYRRPSPQADLFVSEGDAVKRGDVVGLDPDAARYEAQRCLSCGNCFECDGCYSACPEHAVIKLGPGRRSAYDLNVCTGCLKSGKVAKLVKAPKAPASTAS